MITVCKKRHPEKTIKPPATHWGSRDLVQFSPAHVEPLKIIKVDAFGVALNPLASLRGWIIRATAHIFTEILFRSSCYLVDSVSCIF